MAYHLTNDIFRSYLEGQLDKNSVLVWKYREALEKRERLRMEYDAADREFEAIRKEISDSLLKLFKDIDRVEYHREGETW